MPPEEAAHRDPACHDLALAQNRAEFVQRQVRLLADQGEQGGLMLLQRRGAAASRLGRYRARRLPALHPADRRADAYLELPRRRMTRLAPGDRPDNPFAQVLRIYGFGIPTPKSRRSESHTHTSL
jgi:hypothetical protein